MSKKVYFTVECNLSPRTPHTLSVAYVTLNYSKLFLLQLVRDPRLSPPPFISLVFFRWRGVFAPSLTHKFCIAQMGTFNTSALLRVEHNTASVKVEDVPCSVRHRVSHVGHPGCECWMLKARSLNDLSLSSEISLFNLPWRWFLIYESFYLLLTIVVLCFLSFHLFQFHLNVCLSFCRVSFLVLFMMRQRRSPQGALEIISIGILDEVRCLLRHRLHNLASDLRQCFA